MSHKPTTKPTRPLTRLWGFKPFTGIWGALTGMFRRTEEVRLLDYMVELEAIHGKPYYNLVWPPAPSDKENP